MKSVRTTGPNRPSSVDAGAGSREPRQHRTVHVIPAENASTPVRRRPPPSASGRPMPREDPEGSARARRGGHRQRAADGPATNGGDDTLPSSGRLGWVEPVAQPAARESSVVTRRSAVQAPDGEGYPLVRELHERRHGRSHCRLSRRCDTDHKASGKRPADTTRHPYRHRPAYGGSTCGGSSVARRRIKSTTC